MSLRRLTATLFVGQVARLLVQGAYFVVLARALGVQDYGAFAAVVALVAIVVPFSSLGMNLLMIRSTARDAARGGPEWVNAVAFTAAGGLLASVVLAALTPIVAPVGVAPWAVLLIALTDLTALKALETSASLWQVLGRSRTSVALPVAVNAARLVAVLALLALVERPDLESWAVLYLITTSIVAVVALLGTYRALRPRLKVDRPSRARIRDGLMFSVGLSAQSVYNDLDKTMLGRMASAGAAGVYSAAYRLIDLAFAPIRSVGAAAYPLFFKEGAGGIRGAIRLTRRIAPAVLALGVLGGAALWLAAPLAPVLLGDDFDGAVPIVRWLAPMVLLRGVTFLAADTLTGADMQGFRTSAQVSLAVINFGLNLALIPAYGIDGAVASTLVCESILAIALWSRIGIALRRSENAAAPAREST